MTKSLIIVESPAKARTLKKYLGAGFEVKASVGHIRDLPVNSLGVDIDKGFLPQYVTIKGKGKIIQDLKNAADKADVIYLAPDPDREGEAIAFHIAEVLKGSKKPFQRALFHELTRKAILKAVEQAESLNVNLFDAQQARRILDRLVGYQISPLLWDKVRRGLSAGRVQSVAVRMICEREAQIKAFVEEEYWTIDTRLEGSLPPAFIARFEKIDGNKAVVSNEEQAKQIEIGLGGQSFQLDRVEKKQKKRFPSPPFITSSMQIEANRKLRFSAKKTMTLAQRLYEGMDMGTEGPVGLITYMRTDSTRVNEDTVKELRGYIGEHYGAAFVPAKPHHYKTSKSAQDAHEAIRPTDFNRTPEKMAPFLEKDMLSLYSLIWKRFVASQMAPAVLDQTTFHIAAGPYGLKAVGSITRFLGFLTVYRESEEENGKTDVQKPVDGQKEEDTPLPDLKEGEVLTLQAILPKQHFTQPSPRYTEATLVKALEENGVGRPSTYAAIISTIQDKQYVELLDRKFAPTQLGSLVNDLLVQHFPAIIDVTFTASMEKNLDQIAEGKGNLQEVLTGFYGPFKETLDQAKTQMQSVKRQATPTDLTCPDCGSHLVIRWGKLGEFLTCERYPECKHACDFKRTADGKIEAVAKAEPVPSTEICDKCGKIMVWRQGKFGRFLACSGYPKCKNVRAETTGVVCPTEGCKGEIVQKISKKGKVFYSCNRFPKCTFASWDRPVKEKCPLCNSPYLLEKHSKKEGDRVVCPGKDCVFSRPLGDETSESQPPPAPKPTPRGRAAGTGTKPK